MLKTVCSLIFALWLCNNISGQITVALSTLPDAGDELLYQSIPPDTIVVKVDNQVFQTGGNLQWDFSNLDEGVETSESFIAASSATATDSFPDADIVVDFIGLQGYAKRNTTDISIIGLAGDSLAGLNLPIIGQLDQPFAIRRAPFGYEDQFTTSTSLGISLDASAFDTIQQFQELVEQIPGATVDSIRITLSVDRTEDVDGWGTIKIPSGDIPVLKVTQTDLTNTSIEVYAVTFIGSTWIDLTPFLPEETSELLSVSTINHIFYAENKKEVVAEFSTTPDSSLLSTRYSRDITSSLFNNSRFNNLIDVSIYPNPTSDRVNINIEAELLKNDLEIKLFNTAGQLIKSQIINTSNSEIDLINFKSGIHTVSIYSDKKLFYRDLLMISKSQH